MRSEEGDLKAFGVGMYSLAAATGTSLTKEAVMGYYNVLKKYDMSQVISAMELLMTELTPGQRFPVPRQIIEKFQPVKDEDSEAREAAGRIVAAVSRFGWPNPERAKEYVGELGWAVVERQGGWVTVCEVLTPENVGQMQAQWRDLAKSVQKRTKMGIGDEPPKLPEPENRGGLVGMESLMKQLGQSGRIGLPEKTKGESK